IGATKSDALETITNLLEDLEGGVLAPAPERDNDAILRLLDERGIEYTSWDGWHALDAHEKSLGEAEQDSEGNPRPRIKVVEREEMVRVSREGMQALAEERAAAVAANEDESEPANA